MLKFTRIVRFGALGGKVNISRLDKQLLGDDFRITFPNLKTLYTGKWNSAKVFSDRENTFAYGIIENIQGFKKNADLYELSNVGINEVTTLEEFAAFLERDFKRRSASEIVAAFKSVVRFCKTNEIPVSDDRFDKLTDGLMDNVEKLTDAELFQLLDVLAEFPECESYKSHNFHDIWSALDDICCWRLGKWNGETQYFVAEKWYKLHLGKLCDYIYGMLEKLTKRAKRLTKDELVGAFFYMNVCRKRTMDFEYESAVERTMGEMNLDELAVVALGYFKSQSKVKIAEICTTMIRKTMATEEPADMSLCAILKLLRLSSRPGFADEIYALLDHLAPKLHNYSNLLLLHAALLGTSLQILHEPTLKIAAQRIASGIEDVRSVRLKDIERILLPLTMFDYDPETKPDIFEAAIRELQTARRRPEMVQHPRCMPCALNFLALRGNYCYELMDTVLNQEFINETYGKSSKYLPRDVYSLDVGVEIECPDYTGSRLNATARHKAARWLTSYTPTKERNKKLSKADGVYLQAVDAVSHLVGGEEYYKIDHILPQFQRADIIICKNVKTDEFVKPVGLEKYTLGDIMRAPANDTFKWYSVVVIGWNNTIRYSTLLVGSVKFKLRHLNKIGYTPVPVIWSEFMSLGLDEQKKYIADKL